MILIMPLAPVATVVRVTMATTMTEAAVTIDGDCGLDAKALRYGERVASGVRDSVFCEDSL